MPKIAFALQIYCCFVLFCCLSCGSSSWQALIFPSLSWNFKFYKLQELWWIDDSKGNFNASALIGFLKLCPALERLFITVFSLTFLESFNMYMTKSVQDSSDYPLSLILLD